MNPAGKTSFSRMLGTAIEEQQRIEISQDGRVRIGMQTEPLECQVIKRDDFAGMVRLLDIIIGDDALRGRIEDMMKAAARREEAARAVPVAAAPVAAPSAEDKSADSVIVYDDAVAPEVEA
jgi:hypothetical protein